MAERMSRFGVGPHFTLISIAYFVLALLIRYWTGPRFAIEFVPYPVLAGVAAVLIVMGVALYGFAIVGIMRAYNADRLCTTGAAAFCRHPIYASWVVLIVPGLVLLVANWIVLTTAPVAYLVARVLSRREEDYLEERFGDDYREYKRRVPAFLPLGFLASIGRQGRSR